MNTTAPNILHLPATPRPPLEELMERYQRLRDENEKLRAELEVLRRWVKDINTGSVKAL